jgi:hypothetical protein
MDAFQIAARPLSSLAIPASTLSALMRAGYETVQDLDSSNVEQLSSGKCLFFLTLYILNSYRPFHSLGLFPGNILSATHPAPDSAPHCTSHAASVGVHLFCASDCHRLSAPGCATRRWSSSTPDTRDFRASRYAEGCHRARHRQLVPQRYCGRASLIHGWV